MIDEKQLNRDIEEGLRGIFKGIGFFFKSVFFGTRKLKEKPFLIGFIVSISISLLTIVFKTNLKGSLSGFTYYIVYYLLLISPLIYLAIISNFNGNNAFKKIFEQVNFRANDDSYPYLVKTEVLEKKKLINYTFKSLIPIEKWNSNKSLLETAFNWSIVSINQGKKKNLVVLKVIPNGATLSEYIVWNNDLLNIKDGVMTIGENEVGKVEFDLNKIPHVLCAGETGSGKSVILRCMLWQMLLKGSKVFMFDFKGGVEFGLEYEEFGEVITEQERALEVLEMLTKENRERLTLFRNNKVKNLAEYNDKTNSNLCRIGVFIDEIAELMDRTGRSGEEKEVLEKIEKELSTLARLSRATGINLFLGVQRPDAKVITGQIKNNVPVRICGRFADATASEIVLNNRMATQLPQIKGRFLFKVGADTITFQAYNFEDEKHLKSIKIQQGKMLVYQNKLKKSNEKKKVINAYETKETTETEYKSLNDFIEEKEEVKKNVNDNFDFTL